MSAGHHRKGNTWSRALLAGGLLSVALLFWASGGTAGLHSVSLSGVAVHPPCPGSGSLVLPTEWAGVHRYSIPGEWEVSPPPATDGRNRSGVLHVYLKALRWPAEGGGHHLRARGFVAFEAINPPVHWREQYTFRNAPEVATRLRLSVRSASQGWQREVAVEFSYDNCQRRASEPGFDFNACVAEMKAKAPYWSNLGVIDLDFGPADQVDTNFQLLVHGWRRRASLKAQLQDALLAPPAQPDGEAAEGQQAGQPGRHGERGEEQPPQLLRAFPYFHTVDPAKTARIIGWGHQYHQPLGIDGVVMYVLPKDARDVQADPGIRALLADRRLRLVLWDEFAWYEGWRDFDLQIVESHAVLSFWGRHVRVLVNDPDEFLVPGQAGATLPALRATGCLAALREECVMISRRDIYPHRKPVAPLPDEPAVWKRDTFPLSQYKYASEPPLPPKVLLNPNKVFPVDVHFSSICSGTSEVVSNSSTAKLRSACEARAPCSWAPEECVWIAHVGNMHKARRKPNKAQPIKPAGWLWMLGSGEAAAAASADADAQ